MVIVSGPIAQEIGISGKQGCQGPGWPANATIGRAVMQSTVTKAPVGLWLARGSQRLGTSTVVAAAFRYDPSR